jgi:NitT/TauT family transport system substrate-binding protein
MTAHRLFASAAMALALAAGTATAQEKTDFRIAWSIYVGWMPWGYLEESGIMDKWAEKYGIDVEIVQINDYVESINQYTAGAFDGVTATNMDTLSIPSGSGVDTTALIVGDFSNGNDAVILKGEGTLADLAGKPVHLVELSVSHYLLARGLDSAGLAEADLAGVVNTSDADMIAAFATSDVQAVVTWNPLVSAISRGPGGDEALRFLRHPGRDHRPPGRQHRDASGEPRLRQGACRRLVRSHGADGGGRRGGADRACRGVGHRSCRL